MSELELTNQMCGNELCSGRNGDWMDLILVFLIMNLRLGYWAPEVQVRDFWLRTSILDE